MINFYDLPDQEILMTMRTFRDLIEPLGWQAQKLYREGPNLLLLTRPDGKQLRINSSTPPTTSAFALQLADDKIATHSLLQTINVPQPETVIIHEPSDATQLLAQHQTIIVKPADGAHGQGITTNITSLDQLPAAIDKARAASPKYQLAIAQPQLSSDSPELRLMCINYKFVIAIARIPAMVTGDGQHSVSELIDIENQTLRSEPYTGKPAYVDKPSALTYLGDRANYIPKSGEKVRVSATCNVGQGGTVEDYSSRISDTTKSLAELIARTTELPVIGIDFFGDYVIEVNACPSLYYPFSDPQLATKCVGSYVDYLSTL